MKVFLTRISLFALLFFSIVLIAGHEYYPSEESRFISGIAVKHHRLDSLKGRRLLFAGGSNMVFGLNSREVQDSLGLPVVNMGLHAGLGLDFVLNELKLNVRSGDIVFLSPEYFPPKGRYVLMQSAARHLQNGDDYVQVPWMEALRGYWENKMLVMKFNREQLQNKLRNEPVAGVPKGDQYLKRSFNEFGDYIGHLEQPLPKAYNNRVKLHYRYWEGIPRINELADYAKAQNVQIYYLFPTYMQSEYNVNKAVIALLQKDLERDLRMPVINAPGDFVYADSLFFDTVYHLNKQGRQQRTKDMIRTIRARGAVDGAGN